MTLERPHGIDGRRAEVRSLIDPSLAAVAIIALCLLGAFALIAGADDPDLRVAQVKYGVSATLASITDLPTAVLSLLEEFTAIGRAGTTAPARTKPVDRGLQEALKRAGQAGMPGGPNAAGAAGGNGFGPFGGLPQFPQGPAVIGGGGPPKPAANCPPAWKGQPGRAMGKVCFDKCGTVAKTCGNNQKCTWAGGQAKCECDNRATKCKSKTEVVRVCDNQHVRNCQPDREICEDKGDGNARCRRLGKVCNANNDGTLDEAPGGGTVPGSEKKCGEKQQCIGDAGAAKCADCPFSACGSQGGDHKIRYCDKRADKKKFTDDKEFCVPVNVNECRGPDGFAKCECKAERKQKFAYCSDNGVDAAPFGKIILNDCDPKETVYTCPVSVKNKIQLLCDGAEATKRCKCPPPNDQPSDCFGVWVTDKCELKLEDCSLRGPDWTCKVAGQTAACDCPAAGADKKYCSNDGKTEADGPGTMIINGCGAKVKDCLPNEECLKDALSGPTCKCKKELEGKRVCNADNSKVLDGCGKTVETCFNPADIIEEEEDASGGQTSQNKVCADVDGKDGPQPAQCVVPPTEPCTPSKTCADYPKKWGILPNGCPAGTPTPPGTTITPPCECPDYYKKDDPSKQSGDCVCEFPEGSACSADNTQILNACDEVVKTCIEGTKCGPIGGGKVDCKPCADADANDPLKWTCVGGNKWVNNVCGLETPCLLGACTGQVYPTCALTFPPGGGNGGCTVTSNDCAESHPCGGEGLDNCGNKVTCPSCPSGQECHKDGKSCCTKKYGPSDCAEGQCGTISDGDGCGGPLECPESCPKQSDTCVNNKCECSTASKNKKYCVFGNPPQEVVNDCSPPQYVELCTTQKPYCDPATTSCVECTKDEHCPSKKPTCDKGVCKCANLEIRCDAENTHILPGCDTPVACGGCYEYEEDKFSCEPRCGNKIVDLWASEQCDHTVQLCAPCDTDSSSSGIPVSGAGVWFSTRPVPGSSFAALWDIIEPFLNFFGTGVGQAIASPCGTEEMFCNNCQWDRSECTIPVSCVPEDPSNFCGVDEMACGGQTMNNCNQIITCPNRCTGENQVCTDSVCCTKQYASDACGSRECGTASDGCGGTVNCGALDGACPSGEECQSGTCVCTAETDSQFCTRLGKNCGLVTGTDNCGTSKTVDCGTCSSLNTCGGGGTENVCGCTPKTCAQLGKNCGSVSNGCGGTLNCGTCLSPNTCGGGGTANVCGCTPKTCAQLGKNCGSVSNGCGGTLNCGSCSGSNTCGGGGTANVCGCTPKTCAQLGKNCGSVSNGCGGTLNCGSCIGSNTCGGGGTANVCGCTPTTCAYLGITCGSVSNDCGGTLNCGACPFGKSCKGGKCCSTSATACSGQQPIDDCGNAVGQTCSFGICTSGICQGGTTGGCPPNEVLWLGQGCKCGNGPSCGGAGSCYSCTGIQCLYNPANCCTINSGLCQSDANCPAGFKCVCGACQQSTGGGGSGGLPSGGVGGTFSSSMNTGAAASLARQRGNAVTGFAVLDMTPVSAELPAVMPTVQLRIGQYYNTAVGTVYCGFQPDEIPAGSTGTPIFASPGTKTALPLLIVDCLPDRAPAPRQTRPSSGFLAGIATVGRAAETGSESGSDTPPEEPYDTSAPYTESEQYFQNNFGNLVPSFSTTFTDPAGGEDADQDLSYYEITEYPPDKPIPAPNPDYSVIILRSDPSDPRFCYHVAWPWIIYTNPSLWSEDALIFSADIMTTDADVWDEPYFVPDGYDACWNPETDSWEPPTCAGSPMSYDVRKECEAGEQGSSCSAQKGLFAYPGVNVCKEDCSVFECKSAMYCGDGVKNGNEKCDASDIPSDATCDALTGGAKPFGDVRCAACGYDLSGCAETLCGNNRLDTGEDCDVVAGSDGSKSFKFSGNKGQCPDNEIGEVGCRNCKAMSDCCLDDAPDYCKPPKCGNGKVEQTEECDKGDASKGIAPVVQKNCLQLLGEPFTGTPSCTDSCYYDTSSCKKEEVQSRDPTDCPPRESSGDILPPPADAVNKVCSTKYPGVLEHRLKSDGTTVSYCETCKNGCENGACKEGGSEPYYPSCADGCAADEECTPEGVCAKKQSEPPTEPDCSSFTKECTGAAPAGAAYAGMNVFTGDVKYVYSDSRCAAKTDACGGLGCQQVSTGEAKCCEAQPTGGQCDAEKNTPFTYGLCGVKLYGDACTTGQTCVGGQCVDQVVVTTNCGNDKIDPPETCDGADLGGATCKSVAEATGTKNVKGNLRCHDKTAATPCQYNTNPCYECDSDADCDSGHFCDRAYGKCEKKTSCGDGEIQPKNTEGGTEVCELPDKIGSKTCSQVDSVFTGGTLKCKKVGVSCVYDTSACTLPPADPAACGNFKVDAGEHCDGQDFNGANCRTVTEKTGKLRPFGTLKCHPKGSASQCRIDDAGCSQCQIAEDCYYSEGCEDGTCKCDGGACKKKTYCGDGNIQAKNDDGGKEECELPSNVGSKTCKDVNPLYVGGTLLCKKIGPDCVYSTINCEMAASETHTCGNGVRERPESCDGNDLGGQTCSTAAGKPHGDLGCFPKGDAKECQFDVSGCKECRDGHEEDCSAEEKCVNEKCVPKTKCGDYVIQKPNDQGKTEECEIGRDGKPMLDGYDCASVDPVFKGGQLGCDSFTCLFDKRGCTSEKSVCGDGKKQSGEECDGKDFGSETCFGRTFGEKPIRGAGELTCRPAGAAGQCTIDTSGCFECVKDSDCSDSAKKCQSNKCVPKEYCGDGIVQAPNDDKETEECDTKDGKPVFRPPTLRCKDVPNPPNTKGSIGPLGCGSDCKMTFDECRLSQDDCKKYTTYCTQPTLQTRGTQSNWRPTQDLKTPTGTEPYAGKNLFVPTKYGPGQIHGLGDEPEIWQKRLYAGCPPPQAPTVDPETYYKETCPWGCQQVTSTEARCCEKPAAPSCEKGTRNLITPLWCGQTKKTACKDACKDGKCIDLPQNIKLADGYNPEIVKTTTESDGSSSVTIKGSDGEDVTIKAMPGTTIIINGDSDYTVTSVANDEAQRRWDKALSAYKKDFARDMQVWMRAVADAARIAEQENDPARKAERDKIVKEYDERIAKIKDQLRTAQGAERERLQEELKGLQTNKGLVQSRSDDFEKIAKDLKKDLLRHYTPGFDGGSTTPLFNKALPPEGFPWPSSQPSNEAESREGRLQYQLAGLETMAKQYGKKAGKGTSSEEHERFEKLEAAIAEYIRTHYGPGGDRTVYADGVDNYIGRQGGLVKGSISKGGRDIELRHVPTITDEDNPRGNPTDAGGTVVQMIPRDGSTPSEEPFDVHIRAGPTENHRDYRIGSNLQVDKKPYDGKEDYQYEGEFDRKIQWKMESTPDDCYNLRANVHLHELLRRLPYEHPLAKFLSKQTIREQIEKHPIEIVLKSCKGVLTIDIKFPNFDKTGFADLVSEGFKRALMDGLRTHIDSVLDALNDIPGMKPEMRDKLKEIFSEPLRALLGSDLKRLESLDSIHLELKDQPEPKPGTPPGSMDVTVTVNGRTPKGLPASFTGKGTAGADIKTDGDPSSAAESYIESVANGWLEEQSQKPTTGTIVRNVFNLLGLSYGMVYNGGMSAGDALDKIVPSTPPEAPAKPKDPCESTSGAGISIDVKDLKVSLTKPSVFEPGAVWGENRVSGPSYALEASIGLKGKDGKSILKEPFKLRIDGSEGETKISIGIPPDAKGGDAIRRLLKHAIDTLDMSLLDKLLGCPIKGLSPEQAQWLKTVLRNALEALRNDPAFKSADSIKDLTLTLTQDGTKGVKTRVDATTDKGSVGVSGYEAQDKNPWPKTSTWDAGWGALGDWWNNKENPAKSTYDKNRGWFEKGFLLELENLNSPTRMLHGILGLFEGLTGSRGGHVPQSFEDAGKTLSPPKASSDDSQSSAPAPKTPAPGQAAAYTDEKNQLELTSTAPVKFVPEGQAVSSALETSGNTVGYSDDALYAKVESGTTSLNIGGGALGMSVSALGSPNAGFIKMVGDKITHDLVLYAMTASLVTNTIAYTANNGALLHRTSSPDGDTNEVFSIGNPASEITTAQFSIGVDARSDSDNFAHKQVGTQLAVSVTNSPTGQRIKEDATSLAAIAGETGSDRVENKPQAIKDGTGGPTLTIASDLSQTYSSPAEGNKDVHVASPADAKALVGNDIESLKEAIRQMIRNHDRPELIAAALQKLYELIAKKNTITSADGSIKRYEAHIQAMTEVEAFIDGAFGAGSIDRVWANALRNSFVQRNAENLPLDWEVSADGSQGVPAAQREERRKFIQQKFDESKRRMDNDPLLSSFWQSGNIDSLEKSLSSMIGGAQGNTAAGTAALLDAQLANRIHYENAKQRYADTPGEVAPDRSIVENSLRARLRLAETTLERTGEGVAVKREYTGGASANGISSKKITLSRELASWYASHGKVGDALAVTDNLIGEIKAAGDALQRQLADIDRQLASSGLSIEERERLLERADALDEQLGLLSMAGDSVKNDRDAIGASGFSKLQGQLYAKEQRLDALRDSTEGYSDRMSEAVGDDYQDIRMTFQGRSGSLTIPAGVAKAGAVIFNGLFNGGFLKDAVNVAGGFEEVKKAAETLSAEGKAYSRGMYALQALKQTGMSAEQIERWLNSKDDDRMARDMLIRSGHGNDGSKPIGDMAPITDGQYKLDPGQLYPLKEFLAEAREDARKTYYDSPYSGDIRKLIGKEAVSSSPGEFKSNDVLWEVDIGMQEMLDEDSVNALRTERDRKFLGYLAGMSGPSPFLPSNMISSIAMSSLPDSVISDLAKVADFVDDAASPGAIALALLTGGAGMSFTGATGFGGALAGMAESVMIDAATGAILTFSGIGTDNPTVTMATGILAGAGLPGAMRTFTKSSIAEAYAKNLASKLGKSVDEVSEALKGIKTHTSGAIEEALRARGITADSGVVQNALREVDAAASLAKAERAAVIEAEEDLVEILPKLPDVSDARTYTQLRMYADDLNRYYGAGSVDAEDLQNLANLERAASRGENVDSLIEELPMGWGLRDRAKRISKQDFGSEMVTRPDIQESFLEGNVPATRPGKPIGGALQVIVNPSTELQVIDPKSLKPLTDEVMEAMGKLTSEMKASGATQAQIEEEILSGVNALVTRRVPYSSGLGKYLGEASTEFIDIGSSCIGVGGVCRHQAPIIAHIISEAINRGYLRKGLSTIVDAAGHQWAEYIRNGRRYILDAAQGSAGYLDELEKAGKDYFSGESANGKGFFQRNIANPWKYRDDYEVTWRWAQPVAAPPVPVGGAP